MKYVVTIIAIKNTLKLLAYLHSKPNIELKNICSEFDVKYSTLFRIISTWETEGLISKIKKKVMLLGGDKYEYSLTQKGIAFLKELSSILRDVLKESLERRINFEKELPKILDDLKIVLTKEKRDQLFSKIINLFET